MTYQYYIIRAEERLRGPGSSPSRGCRTPALGQAPGEPNAGPKAALLAWWGWEMPNKLSKKPRARKNDPILVAAYNGLADLFPPIGAGKKIQDQLDLMLSRIVLMLAAHNFILYQIRSDQYVN